MGWPRSPGLGWPMAYHASWLPHYFIAQVCALVTAIPGEIAARLLAILRGVFANFTS
jgi:hypothetical protein